MDDVIRLPFEARLLVHFVVACRAAPSCLDARARHEHIALVMRAHDSAFTSKLAKAAEEALALSLDDLMQKVDEGRDIHGPDDRTCVCCGSTEMVTSFTRSSTEYTLHAKRWRSCVAAVQVVHYQYSTCPPRLSPKALEDARFEGTAGGNSAHTSSGQAGPDSVDMPRQRLRLCPGQLRHEREAFV